MIKHSDNNRSIKQIISDATDRELDKEPIRNITPDELKMMVAKSERKRKHHVARFTTAAALVMLAIIGTIIGCNNFVTDVDADKNGKTEIVTEDGVVIEDEGWGSSSEENWQITEWSEVKVAKATIPELIVPEYIPEGYTFKKLTIEGLETAFKTEYLFVDSNGTELIIHQYAQNENLDTTHIENSDANIDTGKGRAYIKTDNEKNKATIQIKDSFIVNIWSNISSDEIVEIIENLSY